MAKIRAIKPEFWTDERIVEVSPLARLLFIGLWNFACDNGHIEDRPKQIELRILPADRADIAQLLDELTHAQLIARKRGWIYIPKLAIHQRIDRRYFATCDAPGCTDSPDGQVPGSQSRFGNHKRWHMDRGIVEPECEFCPDEPDDGESREPDATPSQAPGEPVVRTSSTQRARDENTSALVPDGDGDGDGDGDTSCASDDARCATDAQFEQWWNLYDRKVDRKRAEAKWRLALKKRGITANLLMDATRRYIDHQRAIGKHPEYTKHPATWLNGECWNDDLVAPPAGGAYDDLGNPMPLPRDEWPAEWRTR